MIKRLEVTGDFCKVPESFLLPRYVFIVYVLTTWYVITRIYINDLSLQFSWTAKVFADDTHLFSVIQDISILRKDLNDELEELS